MNIRVVLTGPLSKYGSGQHELIMEIEQESTVGDLLKKLGIPEQSYSFVSIAGVKVGEDRKVEVGEMMTIFPPVAGG